MKMYEVALSMMAVKNTAGAARQGRRRDSSEWHGVICNAIHGHVVRESISMSGAARCRTRCGGGPLMYDDSPVRRSRKA